MAKKVLRIVSTVFLIVLLLLVILMFYARASGNSLSIFGVRVYRVATGSMEPTLMIGDVIVVRETLVTEIHKGDIITYQGNLKEIAGQTITHRVIKEPEEREGTWYLQTQGDAEGSLPDPEITSDKVVGKYVTTLPLIGAVYSFFLTPYGLLTIVVVIVLLFGFEIISLIVSYKSLDKFSDELTEKTETGKEEPEENNESDKE